MRFFGLVIWLYPFSAVRPVAPEDLSAVVHAWNATILWAWKHSSYSSFPLVCEVAFPSMGYTTNVRHLCVGMTLLLSVWIDRTFSQSSILCMHVWICVTRNIPNINQDLGCVQRTFSGVGLQSVVLSDMHPNEEYTLKIRCGAQKNFWKWGDWSEQFSFKTRTTGKGFTCSRCVSSILAGSWCLCTFVSSLSSRCSWCVGMDEHGQHWTGGLEGTFLSLRFWSYKNVKTPRTTDLCCRPFHQPLTQRQSHGLLTGYKVSFRSSEENLQHTVNFSLDISTAPFNLSHMATLGSGKIQASVVAENEDGGSASSGVLLPLRWTGMA